MKKIEDLELCICNSATEIEIADIIKTNNPKDIEELCELGVGNACKDCLDNCMGDSEYNLTELFEIVKKEMNQ